MKRQEGFSLLELLISMVILTTGLLALAGLMPLALQTAARSSPALIAREKAREAVESVHTARDMGELTWPRINNVANGGAFLDGETGLTTPGDDGLVNTADDGPIETMRTPGADHILGTDDDVTVQLTDFRRQIVITDVPANNGNGFHTGVRRITVTIRYRVQNAWRTYTLTTFVSRYS
jgi:prepilin-type N-terminal cleavage/methylation domain-containing protein